MLALITAVAFAFACEAGSILSAWNEVPVQISIVSTERIEGGPLFAGESLVLGAELRDRRGRLRTGEGFVWKSSNTDVAVIDDHGELTAVGGGTATIEVAYGRLATETELEVLDVLAEGDPDGSPWARTVKFAVGATSSFDPWTRNPTPEQQEWMREHYFRMVTYASYFGPRLAWYPNALVYKNAYAIYPGSELPAEHPDWVLRDAEGNRLYIPYGCSGGSCPQYAGDFGNPGFRRHWIEELRGTLAEGYLGVMVDDVNMLWRVGDGNGDSVRPIDPRTGREMTLPDWRRYLAEFMEEIRAAFPDKEIVHNAIWYAGPYDPFVQRQTRAANYIALERGSTDTGIRGGGGRYGYETFLAFIDRVHAMGGSVVLADDDSDTDTEWVYELATYLLIKSRDDMLTADGDRSRMNPDNFWEGYLIELGEPLGHRYKVGGLFRRDYECGLAVLNQPDQPTRTFTVDEPHLLVGGGGATVSSVTLPEYRGAVLVREGCTP